MNYRFFITLFLLAFSLNSFSNFSFEIGKRFRVLGDKGIRDSVRKNFQVEGNVVIINGPLTMYGDLASLDFKNKKIEASGNIQLSSSQFTILAKDFSFDLDQNIFSLTNARYDSGQRMLFGETIVKQQNGDVVIKNGKFSTCLDCNKSWHLTGKQIVVTPKEYVSLYDSYFLIGGIPFFYFPYLIFPIKTQRESGVLFPKINFNSGDGLYFQIPLYWAINDFNDLTFSPGVFGDFGLGVETEGRFRFSEEDFINFQHYFFEKDRFDTNLKNPSIFFLETGLNLFDGLVVRADYQYLKNFDLLRSFNRFIKRDIFSSEVGGEVSLEKNGDKASYSILLSDKYNLLSPREGEKDINYVQLAPSVNFALTPINFEKLGQDSLFSKLNFYIDFDMNAFNRSVDDNVVLRSFSRYSVFSELFYLGDIKNYEIETSISSKQDYYINNGEHLFNKIGVIGEIKVSSSIYRDFDLFVSREEPTSLDQGEKYSLNILPIEVISEKLKSEVLKVKTIYRHAIDFDFSYFRTLSLDYGKDDFFKNQISNNSFFPNPTGLNDLNDTFFGYEYSYPNINTSSLIPRQNTLLINIDNSFFRYDIKKSSGEETKESPYELGRLRFSQGILLPNKYSNSALELSRMEILGNFNILQNLSLNGSEYYFYDTKDHLTNLNINYKFLKTDLSLGLTADTRSEPANKNINLSIVSQLSETFKFKYAFGIDADQDLKTLEFYKIRYFPQDKCWFLEFNYLKNLIENRFSFNYALNYNEKSFKALLEEF